MIAARPLYIDPETNRREQTIKGRHPHAAKSLAAEAVRLPIGASQVRVIASRGYPLWEPIEVMQHRNRRITVAYSDLSRRLALLLAHGSDADLDANWCTFATWSSRTIGMSIVREANPALLRRKGSPRWLMPIQRWFGNRLLGKGHGAIYRSLAAGNRFVFLEIGTAVAQLIGALEKAPPARAADTWVTYWRDIEALLDELNHLDPSWVPTDSPDRDRLRLGLRCYYDAFHEPERQHRAELILAGNLLVSAYEQERVDGYLEVSLSMFPARAMRDLIRSRTGRFRSFYRRWLSAMHSRLVTRFMLVMVTQDEMLQVGSPLPPAPEPWAAQSPFPDDLRVIREPILQALLTLYDTSDGVARNRRASNWISFRQRMNYITNLFRSRQQHMALFKEPFTPEEIADLLAGQTAG